uniref:CRiSP-Cha-1 n=1 Tax=Chamaeleo calyptratus TaxID=179908 RepID=M9T1L6_CHACY
MILLSLYICMAVLLQQSGVKGSSHNAASMTTVEHQKEIVWKHNELRRAVQPPASNMLRMEWDAGIATNAQSWANQCTLKHSSTESRTIHGTRCGENIFMSSKLYSWSSAIQLWYDEVKFFRYNFGATSEDHVIGHYTQVIWATSYQVGCGFASCNHLYYKNFYVCQYCPAGNRYDLMKTPYKAGKPCGDCPNACDKGLCTNPCKYRDNYKSCSELTKKWGCKRNLKENCKASCQCTTEIKEGV